MPKAKLKDGALGAMLAEAINSQPKQCWQNAMKAVVELRRKSQHHVTLYVEGWITIIGGIPVPIAHGWLEVGGAVVDPTLDVDEHEYYPGQRFTLHELLDALKTSKYHLPINFTFRNPDYRAAHDDACRDLYGFTDDEALAMLLAKKEEKDATL